MLLNCQLNVQYIVDWQIGLINKVIYKNGKSNLICPGDERKGQGQSVCKAEKDRQQILEEMKKRTQLLTDNSWIRQRSSSFYKEPIYVGVPMKRWVYLNWAGLHCTFFRQFVSHPLVLTFPTWLLPYYGFLNCDVCSTGLTLWTTWILCVRPHSQPLHSVTLAHTQLLQVTVLQVGTPHPATALDRCYPRDMHWSILLIMAGKQLIWI